MNDFDHNFYYERISDLIFENNNIISFDENQRKDIFLKLFAIFKEIIDNVSLSEKILSATFYSKLTLLLNNYEISNEITDSFFQYKFFAERLKKNTISTVTSENIKLSVFLNCTLISAISNENTPDNISNFLKELQFKLTFFAFDEGKVEEYKSLKLIVKEKIDIDNSGAVVKAEMICYSDVYGDISLVLYGIWTDIFNYSNKGTLLNLINPYLKEGKLIASKKSLVVFEPDILIDTTELTSCFLHNNYIPELFFLNLFADKSTSKSLIIGNLVNFLFDEIVQNSETDFDKLFEKGLSVRPLSLMLLDDLEMSINDINLRLKHHYENIKQNIHLFKGDFFSIEPTFMSPEYGLQGRLDLLIEYKNNADKKDIVELKSGNAPNPELFVKMGDTTIQTGIWVNHHIQTLCYNMLLDSAYDNRIGNSNIYYSSTNNYPVRNAPDSMIFRLHLISVRNKIVKSQIEIANGNYQTLNVLNDRLMELIPVYMKQQLKTFTTVVKSLTKQEMMYFKLFVSFITREILTAQIGDNDVNSNYGASSLWQMTKEQKKRSYIIVNDLIPNIPESDFESQHILFKRKDNDEISVFRKGDICILYPDNIDSEQIVRSQIIKCVIQEIDENKIFVSLRNKINDHSIFLKNDKWTIEQDYNLINTKKLFNSLFQLFLIPKQKRDIILGNIPSNVENTENIDNFDYNLNSQQKEIFIKAISAKDYFLIQGPPGTGKTSYMLKYIVKYYFENTDKTLLISAYTNRAVDEICNVLLSSGINDILRTGSKQSSEHHDIMISFLSELLSVKNLYERIKSTRIIISTVSSLNQNPEIFKIKEFDIAIIDEASQIIEPQIIGIIASVEKFILIGDEKQLPAIVSQPDKMNVKNSDLLDIKLENPRNSYFERLIKVCIDNRYEHSYGMLEYQARMHNDIMKFVAKYFYNNKLRLLNIQKQTDKNNFFSDSLRLKTLSKSRISFINTPAEKLLKLNKKEAIIISEIVQDIVRLKKGEITNNTIGIISPFRAQCAEIKKLLPVEYKKMIDVETVERFQGSEREIIIYSFAVNYEEQLANLSNIIEINNNIIDRKLNVALTRAKDYLIILGNKNILSKNNIYDMLINYIENSGSYANFWELSDN